MPAVEPSHRRVAANCTKDFFRRDACTKEIRKYCVKYSHKFQHVCWQVHYRIQKYFSNIFSYNRLHSKFEVRNILVDVLQE